MDNFNVTTDNLPKKFSVLKIIFIVLGVVLVVEIIYAGWTLFPKSGTTSPPVAGTTERSTARISLTAPQQSFQVGDLIPVSVILDSGLKTISGVDLIVRYDPEILEITKAGLSKGNILDEYPLMSVDSGSGLVSISGISSLGGGFAGKGEFATLNFKAKQTANTSLTINFEKDTTTASNLVEANTSKNILEEVDNLEITIE
ncbi:hypothetical protein HYU45_04205 [Candidatus Daviesbacteria bacterium]|nr:hypothetical protein [Candidatus Daviesbacteria bacterium]